MAVAARNGTVASASTGNVNAAFASGSAPDNSHGMICWVSRRDTVAPTLNTAGWSLVGPGVASGGLWLGCYKARGGAGINNLSVQSGSVLTVVQAFDYAGVYDDDFVSVAYNGSAGASVTTLGTGTKTASEDGMAANVFASPISTWTFGSFSGYTTGASGGTYAWGDKALTSAGDSAASTATWTTARAAVIGVATLRVTEPPSDPMEYYLWTAARDFSVPLEFLGKWEG